MGHGIRQVTEQELIRIQKAADQTLGEIGVPGYYVQAKDGGEEAVLSLCVLDGYFSKLPSKSEIKVIAQGLRAGLARRRFKVKGAKPAVIRDGQVYFFSVRL